MSDIGPHRDHTHADEFGALRARGDGSAAAGGDVGPRFSLPRCEIRTQQWRNGRLVADGFGAEEVSTRIQADADSAIWLDLFKPAVTDLAIITAVLGCHPLAVEDAAQRGQRSIARRIGDHIFGNVYLLNPDGAMAELSLFLTPRAFVTIRKDDIDPTALTQRWVTHEKLRQCRTQAAVLAYGVLDVIVDGHLLAADHADEATDELERNLFLEARDAMIRRQAYTLSVQVADLRRVLAPTTEVVATLVRADTDLVEEKLLPYVHDLFDQARHNLATVESIRERIDRIVQTQLNEQGAQLNETTRRLAAWAAIIAVPTAVTGFYGQNVPFPGHGTTAGLVTSVALIVVLAAGLYWLLRHNKWL